MLYHKKIFFYTFLSLYGFGIKLLNSTSKLSHLYIYTCNFIILSCILFPTIKISPKSVFYIFLLSLIIIAFNIAGISKFIYLLFIKWSNYYGLFIKDRAYEDMVLSTKDGTYTQWVNILKDDIIFNNAMAEMYKSMGLIREAAGVEEYNPDIQKSIEELNKEKPTSFSVTGKFFAGRRPYGFLHEHEFAITTATHFCFLFLNVLTFMLSSKLISDLKLLYPIVITISICYSFFFLTVSTVFLKPSFNFTFDPIFENIYPKLKHIFDRNKNINISFKELEISKGFYKYYFIYYQLKMGITISGSSFLFILISILYIIFIDRSSFDKILNHWGVFFSSVIALWITSFLWLSSILFASQIKKTLLTLCLNLFIFGYISFLITLKSDIIIEKLWAYLSIIGFFTIICSFLASTVHKLLFDKDNPKMIHLYNN